MLWWAMPTLRKNSRLLLSFEHTRYGVLQSWINRSLIAPNPHIKIEKAQYDKRVGDTTTCGEPGG